MEISKILEPTNDIFRVEIDYGPYGVYYGYGDTKEEAIDDANQFYKMNITQLGIKIFQDKGLRKTKKDRYGNTDTYIIYEQVAA